MVGSGAHRYVREDQWLKLPEGWTLGQTAIAVDSADRVYLFNRSAHPMIVADRTGEVLATWGDGWLTSAHGIYMDNDEQLYLPIINSHAVLKTDTEGNREMMLGCLDWPSNPRWTGALNQYFAAPPDRASGPFCAPTDAAVGPDGSIYVSDGYGNARVHRFAASGQLLGSWGGPGSGPGEFHIPHGIWVHTDGRVFVCDRENDRVQIFTGDGDHLASWTGFKRPCDLYIDASDTVYVAEGIGAQPSDGMVAILTLDGRRLTEWAAPVGHGGHAIWGDSEGSLYVNQNVEGSRLVKFRRA
jgi:DNA-binding beta-propeller fold protein YncE